MISHPPNNFQSLTPDEQGFVASLTQLGFGRLEGIPVRNGILILTPWPRTVRHLKLGAGEVDFQPENTNFELKKQFVEFFAQVHALQSAEIVRLEIKHGLPFSMELTVVPLVGTEVMK